MERKNLSLKNLVNIFNSMVEDRNMEDKLVEIPLQDETIGPSKATTIAVCGLGFDWNNGRIFLYPKDDLVSQAYMQERLYGDWHPYPKCIPHRPGTYWVTINEDDGTSYCAELETLSHPDSVGNYAFYCTKRVTAWKERIVPKPYHGNV